MIAKIALALGILGVLLGFAVVVISAALVPLMDGRVSWDEAMLGIIPGAIILVLSFFLAAIALIFVLMNRKK